MIFSGTVDFLSGRRLLVVEDDPFIAADLQDLLASAGAAVLGPVPTVRAALASLGTDRPHAALLDLNLRGERCTPVAEALQAAAVPFVLVTGYSRSQIDEPALREAPIVSKPVQASILMRALQRLLPTAS
jgi:two-component system, response regulator PdtaR